MKEEAQETAIVPTTVEAISEPTARLVEKSFAENTMPNRKQACGLFRIGCGGVRSQTGCWRFDWEEIRNIRGAMRHPKMMNSTAQTR